MSPTGRIAPGAPVLTWRTAIKAAVAVAVIWFLAVPQLRLAWSARAVVTIAQPALLGLAASLAGAALLGLLTILPTHGPVTGVLASIPTTGLFLAVTILAQRVASRDPRLWATARRFDQRLGVGSPRATVFLDELAAQLASRRRQPRRLAHALGWATANWLVDVAALWIVLFAVGQRLSPPAVLVAFALANLAAMIPVTPGGLGVVELTMTITLVGLGAGPAPAAAAVAIYRIFSYWTPIPASALTYLATRALVSAPPHPEMETVPLTRRASQRNRPRREEPPQFWDK
ncbi:MAG: YbhN family protein [Acidimicrobiia bacterium]|nr:YbhN family protein [Acidimicrobiia bacterium]